LGKAASMAKISVKGGFHLAWGLAASTVITSVGVIILARLLSPSDFGLYAIALTIPNLIQYFRDWGTSYAVVKYSAQYNSEGNQLKVKEIIFSGLVFQAILSIVLALLALFLSDFIATSIFQRPEIGNLVQVISLSLLSSAFVIRLPLLDWKKRIIIV
jgi:PST family polysaccharide transporter